MDLSAAKLRFVILPSKNPSREHLYLHNNAYRLWLGVWAETFERLGLPVERLEGEFGRQDLVAIVALGDKPLALHLYSFYAVDSLAAREHPYLKENYPEFYFMKLQKVGVRTVMSWEYMTVHPEFRKGTGNVHLGVVLGGLAHQALLSFGADAAVAPARRDLKINELALEFGGEAVIENVINHNVPCDLIMTRRENIRAYGDPQMQGLIDQLWRERYCSPDTIPEKRLGGNVLAFPVRKKAA